MVAETARVVGPARLAGRLHFPTSTEQQALSLPREEMGPLSPSPWRSPPERGVPHLPCLLQPSPSSQHPRQLRAPLQREWSTHNVPGTAWHLRRGPQRPQRAPDPALGRGDQAAAPDSGWKRGEPARLGVTLSCSARELLSPGALLHPTPNTPWPALPSEGAQGPRQLMEPMRNYWVSRDM